jgi:hypothetical protein
MATVLTCSSLAASLLSLTLCKTAVNGQERWLDAGQSGELRNVGAEAAEFLRFEFKTAPKASATAP